jgi:hypothetical protein
VLQRAIGCFYLRRSIIANVIMHRIIGRVLFASLRLTLDEQRFEKEEEERK